VAKPELGGKRICPNCATKYYDLNRSPILCPKCGTVFEERVVPASRARAEPVPAPRALVEDDETIEVEAEAGAEGAEFVPLDEVEEEDDSAGRIVPPPDEDEEITEFTKDVVEGEFIEDEEEDDVAGFIEGDVETDDDEEER